MAHLLETSILNLSTLIEKETQNTKLADRARRLASWSSQYTPSNDSFEETDQPYATMAQELKEDIKAPLESH
jgi:hypothetical protein